MSIDMRKQRGVALITAVLIVALATILAVAIGFKGFLGQRRSATIFAIDQGYQIALGGEAWASDALRRDQLKPSGDNTDDLTEQWAIPIPPIPVDGGEFEGQVEDMQGRFNLNSLVKLDQATNTLVGDPKAILRFERLLAIVGLQPKWARLFVDWIDQDVNPEFPEGAEDSVYTAQTPPYRTPNMPISRASELLAINGFTLNEFRRLEPFVTALPMGTTINLCTAPPAVLDSLTAQRQYTVAIESTIQQRQQGCFPTKESFQAQLTPAEKAELIDGRVVDEKSSYFQATILVTLGTTQFTLYSLLYRQNGLIRPTLRSFGTP